MSPIPALVKKVETWLRRRAIGPERMVVAVSGGPDSVALLRALLALQQHGATGPLVVAHLNHQLRAGDSNADESFVEELHRALARTAVGELDYRCRRADVASLAREQGQNLERVARGVRYRWLGDVAVEVGARWIATGHTADDQAETVLHHLLRGTGLRGLRGIADRRDIAGGIALIRPLLDVTHAEVLAYLDGCGQTFRIDTTNLDPRLTRNRLRLELLPLLAEQYNPAIHTVLGRLAKQVGAVQGEVEHRAQALLTAVERPQAGSLVILALRGLADQPMHLLREAFCLLWEREGWPQGGMTFDHWDRLAGLASGEVKALDLPGGIRARCRGLVLQVGPG